MEPLPLPSCSSGVLVLFCLHYFYPSSTSLHFLPSCARVPPILLGVQGPQLVRGRCPSCEDMWSLHPPALPSWLHPQQGFSEIPIGLLPFCLFLNSFLTIYIQFTRPTYQRNQFSLCISCHVLSELLIPDFNWFSFVLSFPIWVPGLVNYESFYVSCTLRDSLARFSSYNLFLPHWVHGLPLLEFIASFIYHLQVGKHRDVW